LVAISVILLTELWPEMYINKIVHKMSMAYEDDFWEDEFEPKEDEEYYDE